MYNSYTQKIAMEKFESIRTPETMFFYRGKKIKALTRPGTDAILKAVTELVKDI
jgi:hypothetical protein